MASTEEDRDVEEAKRRDEVLKRMLNTKPQPHKAKQEDKGEKPKGRSPKPRS